MHKRPWVQQYDPGVTENIVYPKQSLAAFLSESARLQPDHPCTLYNDQKITYREMEELSTKLSQALLGLSIKKGDRIGIVLPNVPEFVMAFYGILKSGGVVVAINPQYHRNELLNQINGAKVEVLFASEACYPLLNKIRTGAFLQKIIVVPDQGNISATPKLLCEEDISFSDFLKQQPACFISVEVESEDRAIIQYTGGTTGVPKGAIGLHRNLVANTLQFRHWMVKAEFGKEVFLIAVPMYHVYGMVIGLSLAISMGATLVLVSDPRDAGNLVEMIKRHSVTIFPGVPNLFNLVLRFNEEYPLGEALRSIQVVISGSAPLHENTLKSLEALISGRICEGYGLSEAPSATHCNPISGRHRLGSIGLPLPDVDCRIVTIEGEERDLGPNEIGELVIHGPQIMAGYLDMPEETASTVKNGWLYTGDIAVMDQDGYFYLIDRKKEVIKVGGFQVWPNEVEAVIASHPKVLEVGVAGLIDERAGEMVVAWVVTKPGQIVSQEEIQEWCKRSLAHYKVPTRIEFISQLPRSAVGKILRNDLVSGYGAIKKDR